MGKERTTGRHARRHNPLHVDYIESQELKKKNRKKYAEREKRRAEREAKEYVDPKLSKKIIEMARQQQFELEEQEEDIDEMTIPELGNKKSTNMETAQEDSDEEYSSYEEEDADYEDFVQDYGVDEADQAILDQFLPNAPAQRRNLADLVMEKIRQYEARQVAKASGTAKENTQPAAPSLNAKVVQVYTQVGKLLSRYKSGKLPKAFKIIPSLPNWDEILYLTHPENWTPNAVYQATRIFVSNLKARQSQQFFTHILLERVRDDIRETKKLNYHLYMALKKALYKPAAFFKGILFPLCESGTCTLREAAIIGSVLAKVSVPVLHSSVALMRLAEMDYTGPTSLFMRILLDKKYALPYKVVDAVVFHFLRFKTVPGPLPVLWHQAFLVFCQRYKQDVTPEQKEALLSVLKHHTHHQITSEIRRELIHSTCRDNLILDLAKVQV